MSERARLNIKRSVNSLNDRMFDALYSRALVYNTCWEDPAVDRRALMLDDSDEMLVIASAGCNVLDYALESPARIHAVDMNPRQIALIELKLAGIRGLEYDDFFAVFGDGRHDDFFRVYQSRLREQLSPFAREYWDRHQRIFATSDERLGGLYFHGLTGKFARAFHLYLGCRPRLRHAVRSVMDARSLEEQRERYDHEVVPHMWRRDLNWLLSRQMTMNLLGVPHPQRREVEDQHAGGVAGFIRDSIDYVFREIPLSVNYFWQVYLNGRYTRDCCPEYLKPAQFARLKAGLVERITLHTTSVTDFLRSTSSEISKFVLLDHMDWMASTWPQALVEEWEAILERARDSAQVIFRSAHAWPAYLESVRLGTTGTRLLDHLEFNPGLAASLQPLDRVHTYAGFHIASLKG